MWPYAIAISIAKIFFLETYRSTDFEVHRNWLAITHSLPVRDWYRDETSEWTLDYPPLFAWFEWLLSQIAYYIDPKMLIVSNLNYASRETVIFQRFSVIITDLVLAYGIKECLREVKRLTDGRKRDYVSVFVLTFANAGLVMVDHVHFQYNGVLFGILFLSIARIIQRREIEGAFWFCVLLNMKHIYLYVAPAFFVYLLRSFCFRSRPDGSIIWLSLSFRRLLKLVSVVVGVFAASFGPFIAMGQLQQVLSRLFPFKRGLCHAFWAPNFWALYNFIDKISVVVGRYAGFSIEGEAGSMTSGLVREYEHVLLPSITPPITFGLTLLLMMPCLVALWRSPHTPSQFVRAVAMCGFCAFMVGWHVHEKAILLVLLPWSLVCLFSQSDAKFLLILSVVGHFSLFPLLHRNEETIIKVCCLVAHASFLSSFLEDYWCSPKERMRRSMPLLNSLECLYLLGLAALFIYEQVVHSLIGFQNKLPFLPLMMISVYCGVGVVYCWVGMYIRILSGFSKKKDNMTYSFKGKLYAKSGQVQDPPKVVSNGKKGGSVRASKAKAKESISKDITKANETLPELVQNSPKAESNGKKSGSVRASKFKTKENTRKDVSIAKSKENLAAS